MDSYRSTRSYTYISNFVWRRASTSSRLVHALCSEDNWNLSNRNASLRLKFLGCIAQPFLGWWLFRTFYHPKICRMCKKGEETSHSTIGYLIVCGRVEGSMSTTAIWQQSYCRSQNATCFIIVLFQIESVSAKRPGNVFHGRSSMLYICWMIFCWWQLGWSAASIRFIPAHMGIRVSCPMFMCLLLLNTGT